MSGSPPQNGQGYNASRNSLMTGPPPLLRIATIALGHLREKNAFECADDTQSETTSSPGRKYRLDTKQNDDANQLPVIRTLGRRHS